MGITEPEKGAWWAPRLNGQWQKTRLHSRMHPGRVAVLSNAFPPCVLPHLQKGIQGASERALGGVKRCTTGETETLRGAGSDPGPAWVKSGISRACVWMTPLPLADSVTWGTALYPPFLHL